MRTLFLLALGACSASSEPLDAGPDSGMNIMFDAAPIDSGTDAMESGVSCSQALAMVLGPIDMISSGEVTILSSTNGVLTLYVDASAGGPMGASMNPRVYVAFDGTKAMVTDKTGPSSTAWDLAIKRPVLFTNSGQGGMGQGGAVLVNKDFADVTAADAMGKTFKTEVFVDAQCNPKVDQTGAPLTSFDGWYDYNMMTNQLTPKAVTWLVKGGTGKLYKLAILGYYSTPDGGTGMSGGRYTLRVAPL